VSRRERVLIDGAGLQARLDDPRLVLVEVDERPAIYREGHIAGAHCVDPRRDLQDPLVRDIAGPAAIAKLWHRLGITRESSVVLYGDKSNWWACFGFWLFRVYGLRRLRLLDGGRQAWLADGRAFDRDGPRRHSVALTDVPRPRRRADLRADRAAVAAAAQAGQQLIDVRTAAEFRGEVLSEPGYGHEAAQRAGHIPSAISLPWERLVGADGRILRDAALRERLAAGGVKLELPSITYCRIGERSAHTWFVLHEVLGAPARNYDGSWAEWGSMIGMPIAVGD